MCGPYMNAGELHEIMPHENIGQAFLHEIS